MFIISYSDIVGNHISLKGRVLSEIHVGDKLIYASDKKGIKSIEIYRVLKILAYRKELEFISEGMTCELILSGDSRLNFEEDTLLYINS